MPIEILMPALSPTMTEGNLAKWLKKEGETVKSGEILAEIETDKATMEVEAVDEGILAKILIPEQTENVKVNELIAVLLEEDEDKSIIDDFIKTHTSNNCASNQLSAETAGVIPNPEVASTNHSNNSKDNHNKRIFASPLAKRIAEQNNISISNVEGSGPRGRIIKNDIINAIESGVKTCNLPDKPAQNSLIMGRNSEEYTKITNNNMRKVIARRLCESKQQIPHFYLSIEVNIDKLMSARKEMNSACDAENPAYKISVNDMIIKATAMALRDVPEANASWSEEAILQYNNVDISVAVAIDGGLITPIVKNADQKTLSLISNEMKDLAKRARAGKLSPEEFQGGGFSISNLGMYGIKNFNAIINPPQSCILAIGTSQQKLILSKDSTPITTSFIEVTLSCDHRVVDGAVGAQFLSAFKKYLEQPFSMLV